jgi:hypothetical protein
MGKAPIGRPVKRCPVFVHNPNPAWPARIAQPQTRGTSAAKPTTITAITGTIPNSQTSN